MLLKNSAFLVVKTQVLTNPYCNFQTVNEYHLIFNENFPEKKNTLTGKVVLYVSFFNILRLLEGASFLDAAQFIKIENFIQP